MKLKPNIFSGVDYILLGMVGALVAVGLLMVFSSTMGESLKYGDSFYFLKKQILYLILGGIAFAAGFLIDHNIYRKFVFQVLFAAVISLILVFVPFLGKSVGGAVRWIDLGFFSFQPSEFAKLAVVLYLADAITNKGEKIKDFTRGLLPMLVVVIFICLFILKQPDLGTVLVIYGTSLAMFFIGGAEILHMILLLAISAGAIFAVSFFSRYRMKRLLAFLNPWKDPRGTGFQIIQSLIAVGSGGILGLGLGESRQKFLYLPQQHTDFIFAILCEELGLIRAAFVIAFFVVLISRAFKIAREADNKFSKLLAAGIASIFAFQVIINIAVVIGIAPTTGIPLPFISYGGTSLIISLFSAGVLFNISRASALKQ